MEPAAGSSSAHSAAKAARSTMLEDSEDARNRPNGRASRCGQNGVSNPFPPRGETQKTNGAPCALGGGPALFLSYRSRAVCARGLAPGAARCYYKKAKIQKNGGKTNGNDLFAAAGPVRPEIFAALNDKKIALEAQGRTLYNLSVGTPDFPPAPHIKQALIDAARPGRKLEVHAARYPRTARGGRQLLPAPFRRRGHHAGPGHEFFPAARTASAISALRCSTRATPCCCPTRATRSL